MTTDDELEAAAKRLADAQAAYDAVPDLGERIARDRRDPAAIRVTGGLADAWDAWRGVTTPAAVLALLARGRAAESRCRHLDREVGEVNALAAVVLSHTDDIECAKARCGCLSLSPAERVAVLRADRDRLASRVAELEGK
jgi:hypothetical protein